jgi:hypothetical protein
MMDFIQKHRRDIWMQAGFYFILFFGVNTFVGIITDFVRPLILDTALSEDTTAVAIYYSIQLVQLVISLFFTAYLARTYFNFRFENPRRVALFATLFLFFFTMTPTFLVALSEPAVASQLFSFPGVLLAYLPYVLFYFLSEFFLKRNFKTKSA